MKATHLLPLLLTAAPVLAQPAANPSAPPSLLASAVVAGLVSAVVALVAGIVTKDKEYRNDYFKKVIERRMKGVEAAEAIIGVFAVIYRIDGKDPYHGFIIKRENPHIDFGIMIDEIGKYNIWYSISTKQQLRDFGKVVSETVNEFRKKSPEEKIEIARRNFARINKAKNLVEQSIRNDMAELHKVRKFFKTMRNNPALKFKLLDSQQKAVS